MQIETIKKIVESSLGKKVDCILDNIWEYESNGNKNTLKVNKEDLEGENGMFLLGRVFNIIGEGLFVKEPEDLIFLLNIKNRREHILALSVFEELRVKRLMMYNYPGVRAFFDYGFYYEDNNISELILQEGSEHIKFLYNVREYFFMKKDDIQYKDEINYILDSESTSELISRFNEKLEDYYISLIKKIESQKESPESSEDMTKDLREKSKSIIKEKKGEVEEKSLQENKESKEKNEIKDFKDFQDVGEISYTEKFKQVKSLYKNLVRKLESILEDNRAIRVVGGFKSGIISPSSLYKVFTNESEVFSRKVSNTHKSYSFCLLVDESGSMSGSKTELAGISAILLAEVFNKVGINFSIYGFNHEIHEYKKPSEVFNNTTRQKLKNIFLGSIGAGCSGNNDGYTINYVLNKLLNESDEENKIMIVLSDGNPAESNSTIPQKEIIRTRKSKFSDFDLKQEVKKASRFVNIIGIGIQSECVKNFYENNIVINNVSKLPELLLKIISKKIKRG